MTVPAFCERCDADARCTNGCTQPDYDRARDPYQQARSPWRSSLQGDERTIHLTLKIELPVSSLADPGTALFQAHTMAADEARRAVRSLLENGVPD